MMYVKIPEMLQPVSEGQDSQFMRDLIEAMSRPLPPDDGRAHAHLPCFVLDGDQ